MKLLTTLVAGSAASVLMLNGFALAQQQSQQQYRQDQNQQLTNRDARQFMSQIERDINQMVQSGDLSRLRQWTQSHVADHAVMNRSNSIETEGHSRVISSMTITKPDLLRLQRFVLSGMSEKLSSVEDYQLNIQVTGVEPVGDSAALVKSHVTERATLARRGEGGGRMGQQRDRERDFTTGQGPQGPEAQDEFEDGQHSPQRGRQSNRAQLQLELQATCTHLIERNRDGGRLQIGMGICNAETEADL